MIHELLKRYPALSVNKNDIENTVSMLIDCYEKGGKLLICGNGGSAADCEHIAGELMKGFLKKRPLSDECTKELKSRFSDFDDSLALKLQYGLPAISLAHLTAFNTAFSNDISSELVYAQGLFSLGRKNDVLMCLSTSGNSANVNAAAKTAKALGIKVISVTGEEGGELKALSDICICLAEKETFKVQELTLPAYHYICAAVEAHFFSE